MNILESNLRSAARENFRLYPDCYPVKTEGENVVPTEEAEQNLVALAHGYGVEDGFYDAGMEPEEIERSIRAEFKDYLATSL